MSDISYSKFLINLNSIQKKQKNTWKAMIR